MGSTGKTERALSKMKQKATDYVKEQDVSVYCASIHTQIIIVLLCSSSTEIISWVTVPRLLPFYFERPWSIPGDLFFCFFFLLANEPARITTITAPVSNQLPKFCGLITIALLPCDTLCMMKPSREADWRRKAAELKCCNRHERWTSPALYN